MSKTKTINIAEAISEYDDKFINSITLKDITSYCYRILYDVI